AVEQDGIVPLEELAHRARLLGIRGGLEASSVARLRDLGQRLPDLLVGPPEDQVANLERLVGSAGDDSVDLDDVARGSGAEARVDGKDESENEGRDRGRVSADHGTPRFAA